MSGEGGERTRRGQYCPTEDMLADVLTKLLVSARHGKLCNAIMGLPA
jgi:hypothetical protein